MRLLISTASLFFLGLVIGYLAQRSRMCFIAGFRDFFLVRDRELLTGLLSFAATIWVLTSVLYSLGVLRKGVPEYRSAALRNGVEQVTFSIARFVSFAGAAGGQGAGTARILSHLTNRFIYVTFIGGLVIGAAATLSGGCVLRQHVLLAQGSFDALFFIAGFYAAVFFYYAVLYRFLAALY